MHHTHAAQPGPGGHRPPKALASRTARAGRARPVPMTCRLCDPGRAGTLRPAPTARLPPTAGCLCRRLRPAARWLRPATKFVRRI